MGSSVHAATRLDVCAPMNTETLCGLVDYKSMLLLDVIVYLMLVPPPSLMNAAY